MLTTFSASLMTCNMKTIHIYSDESRQKAERFLILSGMWLAEEDIDRASKEIQNLRNKYGYLNSAGKHISFLGEFKWTKVSSKYLAVYKDLVDIFFRWIDEDTARFCSMLIDTQSEEVIKHSNIKKEGYFKLLYQLYLHNSKVPAVYKIFPDRITNPKQHKVDFQKLDECLEAALKRKFSVLLNPSETAPQDGYVQSIIPTDSKQTPFIQVVDVIMGALGYFQNRYFEKPNPKKAKIELMKYVLNILTLNGSILFSGKKFVVAKSTKFNIWVFKPSKKASLEAF